MSMIDVSRQTRSLLADAAVLDHLPPELLGIIRQQSTAKLLDGVTQAALCSPLTERVFVHCENVFPDICARWIMNAGLPSLLIRITSSFARLLPFAPYLASFLRCSGGHHSGCSDGRPSSPVQLLLSNYDENSLSGLDEADLLESLITLWRLLNFDFQTYSPAASVSYMQCLFTHGSRPVRYLAIRIFCMLLHASDFKLEALIDCYLGKEEAVVGLIDGAEVDFGFLSLFEQERAQKVLALREQVKKASLQEESDGDCLQTLTPYTISYGEAVLPRPHGPIGDPSSLVMTKTTTSNMERLATLLRDDDPILIHGMAGVGKTSFVHELAMQLGKYSDMVTLHLNEQTDAKMLVGLYSTDSKPGSFQWRPGVLTTAVREGRWVLIEDLDRAPTEVLSTLLPLIERKELLIPSRGERIRAATSFRLFATVRTSRGLNGRENLPSLVGMRFWRSFYAEPLAPLEVEEVVLKTYPVLHKFVPGILAVHNRLSQLSRNVALMSRGRSIMDRQVNLRDLLKWCRRLRECLLAAGSTNGDEPISETTRDWMFMEALDCFVGSCPDTEIGKHLTYAIAEEMHMSKDRADHYLSANIPPLDETERIFSIGRAQLRKKRSASSRLQRSKRPFASTAHAKRLLEQIAVAIKHEEPVLLVGETGIGKTTVVQQLADSLGHKLIAVNLSQQSEVGDLLGGFKPVNVRSLAVPLKEEFEDLFSATGISASKNQKYLEQVGKCFAKSQWSRLSKLWKEAPKMFVKIVTQLETLHVEQDSMQQDGSEQPAKRRKTQSKLQSLLELRPRWTTFAQKLDQFDIQISGGSGAFAFSFVEGNLVKAVKNGEWVLLDEINLASPDTLEAIADLLTGPQERPSILLSETGEIEKIMAHPDFRIFGAMNPATDVGKRDLPIGIRSRFTELYVKSPDTDLKDLLTIIKTYLGNSSTKNDQASDDIARLYMNTKRMAQEKRLVDGANEVPHFSLRTLTRVLSYVTTIAPLYGVRRALYEGFSMGFLTLLDRDSEKTLLPLIYHHLLDKHGNPQALLSQPPKHPNDGRQYVKFQNKNRDRHYWLFQGEQTPIEREDYIITPYVERNLLNLVRATSTRRFPVLIQGPTSAGKTSMIEYLANFTGNKFVRINNHEHTDLQEYLGTYVSGADGKLRFQEGLLVQAMRQGHWIVLDELNLAPTDVLEALNRLLDDNRELLIPETQEIVRPHENFILFATQNPPGLYGGRKVLSRAFRNRFLELHFDDIPEDELEYILQQRSRTTSPPDCRRIVTVYKELSRLRQTSRLFEQKDSFATLRDLFRWALREADTREEIAAHGFMLLAERVRVEEERAAVKDVIEKIFKVKLDPRDLYSASKAPELRMISETSNAQGVVWTHAMRRLYVLVSRALKNNEPVLLVGETGCGKTTVVQLLAEALKQELHIVNAHQNTETGDLIGSQRPVRNRGAITEALNADLTALLESLGHTIPPSLEGKLAEYKALDASITDAIPQAVRDRIAANETRSKALFEWSDGALVEAMRGGHFFLLDEISLADDSVLERLNSVLEPQRTLLLAEKGIDNSFVVGSDGFQFFATMNPGGDFGKKELSPALRNRFTEIWVPPLSESDDIYEIVKTKLTDRSKHLVDAMVDFAHWFAQTFRSMATTAFSIREILVWVQFINTFEAENPLIAFVHGAAAIFVDSIGANPSAMMAADLKTVHCQRQECLKKLGELTGENVSEIYMTEPALVIQDNSLSIGDFSTPRYSTGSADPTFAFHAPTTRLNAMRVVRALQMQKPILLEGSPGVGKTTLVAALSQACGRPLTRINLSDQTDLMDLFGTDVPVEGEEAGNFAWRDAPFLQAMQKGEWVLLDEMNLASQSVLEGLNACLDHRGEVYISELDQVFKRHPDFRLFAAQNPHHQGGGRKGLPASFVNRFIVVYADVFKDEDLKLIASHNFPELDDEVIAHLIEFVSKLEHQIVVDRTFGAQGGPWEFNLRDVLRWLHLLSSSDPVLQTARMDDFLDIIVRQRFRTTRDRAEVTELFTRVVGWEPRKHSLYHNLNSRFGQVGFALLSRNLDIQPQNLPNIDIVPRLAELESIMVCVKQNIPCILSSPSGYGKSSLLNYVAALSGKSLAVFPMNADIDTMDLVGGFEQADPLREVNAALIDLREYLQSSVMSLVPSNAPVEVLNLLHLLDAYNGDQASLAHVLSATHALLERVSATSEAGVVLTRVKQLLEGPLHLENPRFEWLDGVIVKALITGQWLVLDNANMCNASVLDRLNSLLEPNGFLSINEHCDSNGKPRIIRPHADFRIFLTMDSRYGELSRAMRNRAIEIHIHAPPPESAACLSRISAVEGCLQRYHDSSSQPSKTMGTDDHGMANVSRIAVEHLSLDDVSLLPRFVNQLPSTSGRQERLRPVAQDLLLFLETPQGSQVLRSIMELYSTLPAAATGDFAKAQSLHMLNNQIISKLLHHENLAAWIGVRYETSRRIHQIRLAIQQYHGQAQAARLASLSRLQRSLISDRVAAVSKDTTVKLSMFLSSTMAAMEGYLQLDLDLSSSFLIRLQLLEILGLFLEQTVSLSASQDFDEAYFQAHVTLGTRKLRAFVDAMTMQLDSSLLSLIMDQLSTSFDSGFQLSTGLSMEALWNAFRPTPISTETEFKRSNELDCLATRFDALRWKAASSLSDLSKAQRALASAYEIARNDSMSSEQLVKDLTAAIEELETRIGHESQETLPFFASDFEYLRQLWMLRSLADGSGQGLEPDSKLITLSNISTKSTMIMASASGMAFQLQSLAHLAQQDNFVWDGKLTISMWEKLQNMSSVSLSSLALLETELPILGQHVAALTSQIGATPLANLNNLLWNILLDTFEAHGSQCKTELMKCVAKIQDDSIDPLSLIAQEGLCSSPHPIFDELTQAIDVAHLRAIALSHFLPAIFGIVAAKAEPGRATYFSALAWLHFSIGLVKLYVPDRIFDPQLQPKAELAFYDQLEKSLQDKLLALRIFQTRFTGQSTSARIDLLQSQLDQLGAPPKEVRPVFRPERSALTKLHAEFSNILKTITHPGLQTIIHGPDSSVDNSERDALKLVQENVSRLIDRLSSRFEAYQDMAQPAVNILRCLSVGLSLCDTTRAKNMDPRTDCLVNLTPFLSPLKQQEPQIYKIENKSFEFLSLASNSVAIDGLAEISDSNRRAIFECFHSFYEDWNKKLDADRKAEAANSSLYRFRGTLEDEEEIDAAEFNELFPTFDRDNDDVHGGDGGDGGATVRADKTSDQVRATSLRVAEAHRKIFYDRQQPATAFHESCMAVARCIVAEMKSSENIDHGVNSKLLTSTILLLGEKMEDLQSAASSAATTSKNKTDNKKYNFYTDANLTEARQLVSLAHKIKARFRELQLVDEIGHMQTLSDVIQSCDKLTEQVHGEPLAKLLPKVEQLHAHVYEWQFGGWASKIYTVLSLHNLLTETVIRWRRLELSTWANLFDMEQKKCQDDAYSWWFVAYQVVVAVPLTMVESRSDLQEYSTSLIENLELYFSSSIIGQFKTRVALLRQLLSHLQMLTREHPSLAIICVAVENFVQYYGRFEKSADEAIHKGRVPIDKKMKDVLLMASWKDTNINALRESARKSHQKLFRLIRKFRGVLGQEMKLYIAQGLPDEDITVKTSIAAQPDANPTEITITGSNSDVLGKSLPGWLESHRRLANLPKTISVMRRISYSPEVSSNSSNLVLEFVAELKTAMADLRKETPSVLNDENKDQVKHLKTRKRKLFADTLRDLRTMGLQHNLSQDKLGEQRSLAVVLSNLATVRSAAATGSADEAEYFLHKTLDLVPRAREASREHSEDLSSAEVVRSVGYVEGLLNFVLSQRRNLGTVSRLRDNLQESIIKFKNLGDVSKNRALLVKTHETTWPRLLPWLIHGIEFAIRLVEIHGKIGQVDNQVVIQNLRQWATRMSARSTAGHGLLSLPSHFSSASHEDLEEAVLGDLNELEENLESLAVARPDLAFIVQRLSSWTHPEITTNVPISRQDTELIEFADSVSTLTDTVLVAIEGVKKKGAAVPRDDNEAGWLTKHNEAFFAMIHYLRMDSVERRIRMCIDTLQQVRLQDDALTSQAAVCLIGLATPILDQFFSLCSQSIEQGQELHRATAHMAYNLTKAFHQIASQGFCTPQEKSDETSGGDAGQLEAGTGLGDGEGAEDISKDIQADEDLTELAQEANKEKNEDMKDEKDAVDMADEDLEGQMDSAPAEDEEEEDERSQKGDDEEDEENDMDEEAGDVDDLDPTAVDEKMWDGDDEEQAEKDQQGNEAQGQKQDEDDEQMAAEEDHKKKKEAKPQPEAEENKGEDEQPQNEGAEENEEEQEEDDIHAPEKLNRQDQNVEQQETLDLPQDMELDLDDKEGLSESDDELDDLSDLEDAENEPEEQEGIGKDEENEDEEMENAAATQQLQEEEDGKDEEMGGDEIDEEEEIANGADEVKEDVESDVDDEADKDEAEQNDEAAEPQPHDDDNANADVDNAAPSEVKSSGLDENQQQAMDVDEKFQAQAAQQDQGEMGDGAADQDTSAGSKGDTSRSKETVDKSPQEDDADESASSDPFRKLGDALEKWHRQNTAIQEAKTQDDASAAREAEDKQADDTAEQQGRQEYQHLQNDDAAADTQAMGKADEDEVQPIDESMAIDEEEGDQTAEKDKSHAMEPDGEGEDEVPEEADKMDVTDDSEAPPPEAGGKEPEENGRTGVQTRQGNYDEPDRDAGEEKEEEEEEEEEEEAEDDVPIEETSEQLSSTHITDDTANGFRRDYVECLAQWSEFQAKSHALSLSLTSQLRLILTPSQSTKLSGSFRTGKRLNIKRIIPYIASSYKRDKIWMRRAMPTKRRYQILLCVDDSKSMGESSSGRLAMESLVMVSRSLAMLEAGQVGVVGFGGDVFTAHELTDPFTSPDAGAKVLQKFSFAQDRTDMALLVRQTLQQFRTARQQQSHSQSGTGSGADLWQLALILSDGLTPSSAHDSIRRLLREAMEERIMVVFIIMDDTGQKQGDSVLELKEARFVQGGDGGGESRVVIERYLDTFPFQYYLIVHDLEELPTALAGLLRTWFAEVTS